MACQVKTVTNFSKGLLTPFLTKGCTLEAQNKKKKKRGCISLQSYQNLSTTFSGEKHS